MRRSKRTVNLGERALKTAYRYSAMDRDSAGHRFSDFHHRRSASFHFKTVSGSRTFVIEDYVSSRKMFVRISAEESGRRRRLVYLETSQAV
ncbi:unnamed protein product [Linum trigynum]|uniref:Uncharacterized protein n=1 Tax=Linum trigynum TaxID=586398 RepID=A0AAV2FEB6_9ROSI